jgi:hypothetical protein
MLATSTVGIFLIPRRLPNASATHVTVLFGSVKPKEVIAVPPLRTIQS